ncbi:hypothetical protein EsDP_00000853 [Epichloe bromicola]|uniref:HNH nuclease domain-containing protein n=1 Tax=Epichloe bromicola TaxID=79588 RepID=A0ABQ0CG34_9HYPO
MRLGECHFTPEIPANFRSHIAIRHPGYIRGEDHMFSLPRLDAVDSQDETDGDENSDTADNPPIGSRHGVHFDTLLVACQIITGNGFDTAYLSYDRPGHDRVRLSREGILVRNQYYLHVPQGDGEDTTSYAVTPNFQEWRFPASLPRNWQALAPTELGHQPSCIISGSRMVEKAHVIPQAHNKWYTDNSMFDYSAGARSVSDSDDNRFRLRPDLHKVFGDRAFAVVPKQDGRGQRHLVVHFFSVVKNFGDTALDIHNRKAHSLESVAREFLFARFALTVFARIKDFVLEGDRRKLAITQRANDASGCPAWVTSAVQMDRVQRNGLYGGGGSRSSSPTKRSRNTESQTEQKQQIDDVSEDPDLEECRGRSRVRSWVLANAAELEGAERDPKRRRMSKGRSPPPLTTSLTLGTLSNHDNHELKSAGSEIFDGHDFTKNYAGRTFAKETKDSPVVILDTKARS